MISFYLFINIVVGIEEGLNLAAEELSNEQLGARFNATKFMIIFSDGDFPLFSPVSITCLSVNQSTINQSINQSINHACILIVRLERNFRIV